MKLAIAAGLLYIFASQAIAQEVIINPPFKISWNDSLEKIQGRFPDAVIKNNNGLIVAIVSGAPDESIPSNTDFMQLVFHDKLGLLKVIWTSENIDNDIHGTSGKEAFDKLYNSLSSRLGSGEKYNFARRKLYKDSDEFYECLEYSGCGAWAVFWKGTGSEESSSMLKLNGLSRGVGYISYGVEHPNFYKLKEGLEQDDLSKF